VAYKSIAEPAARKNFQMHPLANIGCIWRNKDMRKPKYKKQLTSLNNSKGIANPYEINSGYYSAKSFRVRRSFLE